MGRAWIVCVNETESDPEFWDEAKTERMIGCPEQAKRLIEDLVNVPCSQSEARRAVQWCAAHFPTSWKHNIEARPVADSEWCQNCDGRGWIDPDAGPGSVINLSDDLGCPNCHETGVDQRRVVDNNTDRD